MGADGPECRFQVLGPIEAHDEAGGPIALRSPVRRRLLALFLARPFENLPADRLIDHLWYDDPPLGRGAFHIQVSRLRRDLGATGGLSPIVTVPNGYRFQVEHDTIDWLRFVDGVEAARAAPTDSKAAVLAYQQALGLWRGSAFEDTLGSPQIDDQARYLDGLRRTATLELAALLARLGHGDDLVGLLRPIHAEEPFDEPIACALARALGAGGRTSAAIEVLQATTASLRDELRAEPTDALVGLLHDLRERPGSVVVGGGPEVADGSGAIRTVPALALPILAESGRLIGRRGDGDRVLGAVLAASGPGLIEITGPSGFGKTSLAILVGHTLRDAGHVVRYGACTTSAAVVGNGIRSMFADLLRSRPLPVARPDDRTTAAELAGVLTSSLVEGLDDLGCTGPLVLVADDLDRADTVDRLAIEGLVSVADRPWFAVVVATGRAPLTLRHAPVASVELGVLSAAAIGDSVGGDAELAAAIEAVTSGHPLTVGHVVRELDPVDPPLRARSLESLVDDPHRFGLRYGPQLARCSAPARQVLSCLAAAGTPLPAPSVQAIVDLPDETVATAVVDLIDDGLLVERPDRSLAVAHEILASIVRRDLSPEFVESVHRSLLDAPAEADPWIPTALGSVTLDAGHQEHLLRAAQSAVSLGAFDEALRIGDLLVSLGATGTYRVRALVLGGSCLTSLGREHEAESRFRTAYEEAQPLGDEAVLVQAVLGWLGNWNAGSGPTPEQADVVDEVLARVQRPGLRSEVLSRAINLHLGSDPRCGAWATEAMALAGEADDPLALAAATCAFSNATLGRPGIARRYLLTRRVARGAPVELGFDRYAALVSHHFVAACEMGEVDEAAWCVERHRWIAEVSRRPLHRWRAAVLTGTLHLLGRDTDAAGRAIDEAADTRASTGSRTAG